MKCNHYILATLLLLATQAFAVQSKSGFCEVGGKIVSLSGFLGTPLVQGSYPSCLVTVYQHGTSNLATLYSDNASSPTPMSNPFTAASNGAYTFYSIDGHYDVVLSGGGMAAPVTVSDVLLFDLSSFSGPVLSQPLGFIGAALTPRIILNPAGFASSVDTGVNTMMQCGISSLSGGGTRDACMYIYVGTSATALDGTRQRIGIQFVVNSTGADKAIGVQGACYAITDCFTGVGYGTGPQPFNGVLGYQSRQGTGGAFELFPDTTGDAVLIFQHAAVAALGAPASSGRGLILTDESTTLIINGSSYTTAATGTTGNGISSWKHGAGANFWARRYTDGTAFYCDDSGGTHWCDLTTTAGEPKLLLSGISAPVTIQMNPTAGQLARINLADGASVKYQIIKDASNNFNVYDSANARNAIQIVSGDVYLNNAGGNTHANNLIVDTGINSNASGFKHITSVAGGCNTAAAAGAACDTDVAWTSSFANTSYTPVCVGMGISGGVPLSGGVVSKAVDKVVFRTVAATAVVAAYTNITCIAAHN